MANSRIKNLITDKTLKDAASKNWISRSWKLTKEKVGADNGLFKIKSGLGARLKTLANPTTAAQRTEMGKWKKGNESNPKKAKRDENSADNKTRKRRLTDTIIQSEFKVRVQGKDGHMDNRRGTTCR